jgi:outer membrane protein assembly factor BamE
MKSATKFIILAVSVFNFGCATNMLKQFDRVKVGMEKDQVLAMLDSPDRAQRWKGQDRWTYIIYEDDVKHLKQIHFENGQAVYVGDIPKPEISAAEKDLKNETENQELESLYLKNKQENQEAFQKYETEVSGSDQIRYVPQFTPVQ